MSDTTVAILAGGQGSRLGGIDKGLAILAEKPLVEWALAALDREDHAGVYDGGRPDGRCEAGVRLHDPL